MLKGGEEEEGRSVPGGVEWMQKCALGRVPGGGRIVQAGAPASAETALAEKKQHAAQQATSRVRIRFFEIFPLRESLIFPNFFFDFSKFVPTDSRRSKKKQSPGQFWQRFVG